MPEEKNPEEKNPEEENPEEEPLEDDRLERYRKRRIEELEKARLLYKKKGIRLKKKWFSKIPTDVLLSPGGMVLIFFALLMETLDLIPIPFVDQLWELPLELIFIFLLIKIAKVPLKTAIIPFLIERIPIISDILPTWVIRMFV